MDPNEKFQDTWHFNLTASRWVKKHIDGVKPVVRYQYAVAMWDQNAVIFGGYGSECENKFTGSPGLYCAPKGEAYFLGDTWHYTQRICPRNCMLNGTCHYGSCICGKGFFGLDCSNRTCPDCTYMNAPGSSKKSFACEIWDVKDNPVTLNNNPDPKNPVSESHHRLGPNIPVTLSNGSILDGNCYYDFAKQEKICRSCSLRGTCDFPTGNCVCEAMYSNFDCSYRACPHPLCNGGGTCLLRGECVCRYATFEKDCSISFECPNDCSFQGICEPGGKCRCYDGFYGNDCRIEVSVSAGSMLSASWTHLALPLLALVWGFAAR